MADSITNGEAKGRNESYSAYSKELLKALQPENRYRFIQPGKEIVEGALDLVKGTLDGLAGEIVDEQMKRVEEARRDKKRKREVGEQGETLKIRKVHTKGFAVEQVWEQARRVIDALRSEVGKELEDFESESEESGSEEEEESDEEGVQGMKFDEDGFEVGSEDESLEDGEGQEEEVSGSEAELDGEDGEGFPEGDEEDEDLDMEGMDMDGEDDYEDSDAEEENAEEFVEDPHGLNDGFFSIDEFNKQTEFLEQQDAAADPYTGEASDEEEIDWDADPMAAPALKTGAKKSKDAESEDDDDEDGPTFGNMDLNAPEGASDDEDEDEEMADVQDAPGDNTNDILYKDFFAPPPRKVTKAEKQAAYLARQEKKAKSQPEDEERDIERAMADVRRDLFDDESEDERSEDALSDRDAGDPKSRKSAHERRQAKLAEEIRRLEAASVAKREWTLSGEAKAMDRPVNSLLEEDLDFERTGKPVPVITAEVSESIEELIKRRILAQEFDEVIRRRPDSDVPATARRGAFELDDTKAQKSLAEMYEEEHVKANNPDTYVSQADEKLKKQHLEIEGLWKEVSAKLDALSSWHYKPKPAAPSLTVVSDVATVQMEDAQPTMASGISGADSMLAPQEIYKAGKDKEGADKMEIVPKTGAPIARQEMTREEKLRRRRREKERIKKRGGEVQNKRPENKKKQIQKETMGDLKKAGVRVIGRRGEIQDMDGKKVKVGQAQNGAGGYKL